MFLEILLLVILLLCVVVWKIFDNESPLDKLPGPPRYYIIGSSLEFIGITPRNLFVKVRGYAKKYGSRFVVRILNRRILHINAVKDVEIVLSHSKNIQKSMPYSFLEPWLGTGLLLSYGAKWQRRRKILTPTFHFNILKSFALVFEEKSRALVEKLKGMEGSDVDLLPVISECTLFTICETAMGTQLDSDRSSEAVKYKGAITEIGSILLSRLTRVWLHNDLIFRSSSIGKKFQNCLASVHSFADNVILKRKKNWTPGQDFSEDIDTYGGKKRMAMLDLLLEAESKGEIDLEGIREEVNTFMFEGHDTTAMALVFGLHLIAGYEDVQERIYEECKSIINEDRPLTMSDFTDMKYLEAVIREVLRLYPSVPFIARTITEDFMLDDLLVPKGSEVAVHIYDLHRSPDLFPAPEMFKPERFLSRDMVHPYAFVPFSAGPRNCIGQRFAMLEMKSVLSSICRNFKLSTQVKGRPECVSDMLLRPSSSIYVRFTRRKV